ncbi:hypothetical protein [Streptomyces sp. C184]|uniref:hypothetical protein n=1 Tax=Streptomyces sp. C184 TaxID=3237121 RepID=UPI0034C6229F
MATPIAVWGLMGQQNAPDVPASEQIYVVRPWDLPTGVETLIGICAALVALGCGGVLAAATRYGLLDDRWWQVLTPLVLAGLTLGAGWRVLTAGIIGFPTGAGYVIFLGGPLLAALLGWSAVRGYRLASSRGQRARAAEQVRAGH